MLVYVATTAIFAIKTNPTITKFFFTSEGISQAIIAQTFTFRSGFHVRVCTLARSTVFKTYPCYHFSPLLCNRWYVIALHTGSPLSENAYLYLPLSCWLLFEIASFAKMATCSYSELVGGSCSSRKTSGESKCVVITKCKRDAQGHLKTYQCGSFFSPEQVNISSSKISRMFSKGK